MSKKHNLITKFQGFWNSLDEQERHNLWSLLTSIRGYDGGCNSSLRQTIKTLTTARIRGLLFNEMSFKKKVRGYSYPSYTKVPYYQKKRARSASNEFFSLGHFTDHVQNAIRALNEYLPKKAVRDLQKFLPKY